LLHFLCQHFKHTLLDDEIITYKELLKALTEVFQRHSNNEEIALNYLEGIVKYPYCIEQAVDKMIEVVRRFPNSDRAKGKCGLGIWFLAHDVFDRDYQSAQKYGEILGKLYVKTGFEGFATNYSKVLQLLACKQLGFFEKRHIISELKKLSEQFPNNETILDNYLLVADRRAWEKRQGYR